MNKTNKLSSPVKLNISERSNSVNRVSGEIRKFNTKNYAKNHSPFNSFKNNKRKTRELTVSPYFSRESSSNIEARNLK
jgi:hypothetical protein